MLSVNAKSAVTLVILGGVIFLLVIPLYLGKVKRNPIYGFRIRKAFESEENWFKINRYGAVAMMCWAVLLIFMGIVCMYVPPEFVLTTAKISIASIIIPVIQVLRYAKRL
jgi:hypothetical protein